MDEFLSEKEQLDRIRQWWRDNGWFIIGGAALGALALFGWNQYGEYKTRQAEAAAGLYLELKQATDSNNRAAVDRLLAQLRAEHEDSAYTAQAALLVAQSVLVTDPARASEELRFVMENSDDAELAMIARMRLARVLAYRELYQDALQVLDVREPGEFAGRIAEIKGDIYVALGDEAQARIAYLEAMAAPGSEVLDRGFLQMKLSDLLANVPQRESTALPPVDPAAVAPVAAPVEVPEEAGEEAPAEESSAETPAAPAEATE